MFTWAVNQSSKKHNFKPVVKSVPEPVRVYDTVLLKKFDQLLVTLDFNKNEFCYEGKFNVMDGKDTTNNVRDLKFLFCRSGKSFYSKLGNVETVNVNGTNVFVQHDMKRIVVSAMDYQAKSTINNLGQVIKTLKAEDYALICSSSGGFKTIAMVNERHITCKELALTYDTLKNTLCNIKIRFTDFNDPANKKKERVMQMAITKIQNTVRIKDYPGINNFIKYDNGKMVLLPRFSNYELIKL